MKQNIVTPTAGYILAAPYIEKDRTFVSGKSSSGEDKKSEVLQISKSVIDSTGIERLCPCQVGDIILHADSNKTFEVGFAPYYMVHFTEVHGILTVEKTK